MAGAPSIERRFHEFETPEALAEALAKRVRDELAAALSERGHATLAVSGGSTPKRFFSRLSRCDLDWGRVTVTLVDERLVAPDHARSNERLVRETLLAGHARDAQFVPLFEEAGNPDLAAQAASARIAALPPPLDVCVLGMGLDGHTASFFPDAPNLSELLDNAARRPVLPVIAASAGEPRLTLSADIIGAARFLALHIEGKEKNCVLKDALDAHSSKVAPIRAVLERARAIPDIFWAE